MSRSGSDRNEKLHRGGNESPAFQIETTKDGETGEPKIWVG